MKLLTTDNPCEGTVAHYRIDSDRRMRIEEYQGKVGLVDLKSIISAMVSDPCWSPDFHGLVDFSEAELDLTANEVLRLALVLKRERNRTSGWMVFVASNSTVYGIVRMLAYWSRNMDRMRIFKDRSEAETWLEHNRDQVPPSFRELDAYQEVSALRNAI
jgi:hypothetical protein